MSAPDLPPLPIEAVLSPKDEDSTPKPGRGRPRGSTTKATPGRSTATRTSLTIAARNRIAEYYKLIGMSLSGMEMLRALKRGQGMPEEFVGAKIVEQSEAIADAYAKMAETNPALRKALEKLVTAGATGELVMAHLPILLTAIALYGPDKVKPAATVVGGFLTNGSGMGQVFPFPGAANGAE